METGKVRKREEIISKFKDGMTICLGSMGNMGSPRELIEMVIESGAKHLTTISIDSGDVNLTTGRLVHEGRVDKMYVSHIGKNPETQELIYSGKMEVEFVPMGTLIERVRCGGYGLGGVLTKTGLGTMVQTDEKLIEVNGEKYLLETALRADVALVHAYKSDTYGNLSFFGTDTNSNPIMATAADFTVVEAEIVLPLREMMLSEIHLPGAYVDMVYDLKATI